MTEHRYRVDVVWTGETTDYRSYSRNHEVLATGRPPLPGSADPVVGRGDPERWNPEQLLLASLSQCHMLWYLHLCAAAGIVVVDYLDEAEGVMNSRQFEQATLHPRVTITDAARTEEARGLHAEANKRCFIANSVNFPVHHEPDIRTS
ncbi:OsmC family protein [Nocardia nova]|uniref:OsmC family protein n=1 Tax=Nocardia nova TaxID=37330 RepID=UPI0033D94723